MEKKVLPAVDVIDYEHDMQTAMKTSSPTRGKAHAFAILLMLTAIMLLCALATCAISVYMSVNLPVGHSIETNWSTVVEYDWGDNVTIGGRGVPVLNWFEGEMKTDNIKDNLG